MDKLYPLVFNAGIQRDGTQFSTRSYIDGVWCRFQRGFAKKILGYKSLRFFDNTFDKVPRGTIVMPYDEVFHIYFGTSHKLYLMIIDENKTVLAFHDVTPNNFVPSGDILWTFDFMFSADTQKMMIIAHPGYNLNSVNNRARAPVYFGFLGSSDKLEPINQSCSGGILVLHPYLLLLDNDGTVRQSAASKPTVFPLDPDSDDIDALLGTRITAQKLIAGVETRGGPSSAPCGLIWSLDTLYRYSFVVQSQSFRADKIGKSSLLSNRAIAELDNIFIWAGTDRFMYYNGTINYLPNNNSTNFFFDNLNYQNRNKVWCSVIPHFNEVWFHFPKGDSTECNWAIVYNKELGVFYDTPINRTCGYFDYSLNTPIWLNYESPNGLNVWTHEVGYDKVGFDVDGNVSISAIQSYIQTGSISFCALDPTGNFQGIERQINLKRLEPDFLQAGDITLYVIGKTYANSEPVVEEIDIPITSEVEKIDIHSQFREVTLKFESNVIGGYFEMGNILLDIVPGDVRP